jgi:hypothetical protein
VYNASDIIVQFISPIGYFSYSDKLDTLFVVTQRESLHAFNQHIITSNSEVRWGVNRTRSMHGSSIRGMELQYFFFIGNQVVIKLRDAKEHFSFPHVLSCTGQTVRFCASI